MLREPLLAGSHLFGLVVGVIGSSVLISSCEPNSLKVAVAAIYGAAFVMQFAASAVWHGRHHKIDEMLFFEKLDYAAIYLFIAATYTPLCIFGLPAHIGMPLMQIEWIAAGIGVFVTLRWGFSRQKFQVLIFLFMGWVFLFTIRSLLRNLSAFSFDFLLSGAFFYTIGSVIFAFAPERIFRQQISSHFIWHLLVLAGAFCHMAMVYNLLGV